MTEDYADQYSRRLDRHRILAQRISEIEFERPLRLLFAMGRRGLLDARLARIDEHFRTPKIAVAFTVVASFLGQAVLVPISEVGSLAAAVGWLATCLAFCNGAGGVASTRRLRMVGYGEVVNRGAHIWTAPPIPHWTTIACVAALLPCEGMKRGTQVCL